MRLIGLLLGGVIAAFLLVLSPGAAYAQQKPYLEAKLENGMRILAYEDSTLPLVAMSLTFEVGAADDPTEFPGAASLIAKLWQDAPTLHIPASARSKLYAAAAISAPMESSYAGFDYTNLSLTLPSSALELGVYALAERIGFAADAIQERDVRAALQESNKAPTSSPSDSAISLTPLRPTAKDIRTIGSHWDPLRRCRFSNYGTA